MATELQVYNMAIRLIGAKVVTAAQLVAESTEEARILEDVADLIRDEVLAAHPWNFAIKRAELTLLGGTVSTWTAEGTTNVWQAALTTEPARVEFDGTEGDEQTSIAACTAARYWFWESNILYVYSTSDPDSAYTEIKAIIPEFDWTYAFDIPSDCLRVIKAEDNVDFVREASRIFSEEEEMKIQYIAQITDVTIYPPAFVAAFATKLAAEIAYPLTNATTMTEKMHELYLKKLKIAKAIDAQEGTGQEEKTLPWEESRE